MSETPEVNMAEWLDSGQAAELEKLLKNPTFRLAIRVVSESLPIPMPLSGTPESDIVFAAGMTAGYALCLENLRKLSQKTSYSEPSANFETPRE